MASLTKDEEISDVQKHAAHEKFAEYLRAHPPLAKRFRMSRYNKTLLTQDDFEIVWREDRSFPYHDAWEEYQRAFILPIKGGRKNKKENYYALDKTGQEAAPQEDSELEENENDVPKQTQDEPEKDNLDPEAVTREVDTVNRQVNTENKAESEPVQAQPLSDSGVEGIKEVNNLTPENNREENGVIAGIEEQARSNPELRSQIQEEALRYLRTQDKEWFEREYSGLVSPNGYLIDKDGNETNVSPIQAVGAGYGQVLLAARRKRELINAPREIIKPTQSTEEVFDINSLSPEEQEKIRKLRKQVKRGENPEFIINTESAKGASVLATPIYESPAPRIKTHPLSAPEVERESIEETKIDTSLPGGRRTKKRIVEKVKKRTASSLLKRQLIQRAAMIAARVSTSSPHTILITAIIIVVIFIIATFFYMFFSSSEFDFGEFEDLDPVEGETGPLPGSGPIPGLTIAKSGPGSVDVGEVFTHTIHVTYMGTLDVIVYDPIPQNAEYVSSEPPGDGYSEGERVVSWRLRDQTPVTEEGNTRIYAFEVSLRPIVDNTEIVNQAYATAAGAGGGSVVPGEPPNLNATSFEELMRGQGRNTGILGNEDEFVEAIFANTQPHRFQGGRAVYEPYIRDLYRVAVSSNINPVIMLTIWGVEQSLGIVDGLEFGCALNDPSQHGFANQVQCSANTLNNWMSKFDEQAAANGLPVPYTIHETSCFYDDPFLYAYEAYTPVCSMDHGNDGARTNFQIYFKEFVGGT